MAVACWVGTCERCGQHRDLGLEPGSTRRVCVDCYRAVRVDRPVAFSAGEIELAARFAQDWAARRALPARRAKARR
jgi:hypothetical protein